MAPTPYPTLHMLKLGFPVMTKWVEPGLGWYAPHPTLCALIEAKQPLAGIRPPRPEDAYRSCFSNSLMENEKTAMPPKLMNIVNMRL